MNPRFKLVVMNLAVAAALIYRWRTGSPISAIILTGIVMFTLVNGLLWLSQRRFNQYKR